MKKLTIVLILGALVGCGGDIADQAMGKMKSARDKACACKDVACAEGAKKEFMDWMQGHVKELKKAGKPSKSVRDKFEKLSDEADACIDKLRDAAAPPPAIDVPPSVPAPEAAPPAPTPAQ
ncbi:MAG TPA: hypothetical protein VHE35_27190 [Kofleriaceae bacterium]|nr:hypothetical protein [Kofleriaceae bacterium]